MMKCDKMGISRPLLTWYDGHKRDLPWRRNPTPYAVWVCEIMAQQTRIAQLLPFYLRFMECFPTVEALAAAPLDDVLAVWAGMGYYARARNLHAAAKVIVNEYEGRFPETMEAWQKLPGVGAYTAGAVMSIAFGAREAAVDGNALRVYARLADDDSDIGTAAAKSKAAAFITSAMPNAPEDIRRFSQAFMELGAMVCIPGRPLCEACPLAALCLARLRMREHRLPVKTAKKPPTEINITVLLLITPDGRVLMRKRTEKLLHGLWVFDLTEGELNPAEALGRAKQMGFSPAVVHTWEAITELGAASHVFTHRVWRMRGYALYVNETLAPEGYRFVSGNEMGTLACPKAIKYYLEWYHSLKESFHLSANQL